MNTYAIETTKREALRVRLHAVLRHLADNELATARDIEAATGMEAMGRMLIMAAAAGYATAHAKARREQREYSITPAGLIKLREMEPKEPGAVGELAAPRQYTATGTYQPPRWHTRIDTPSIVPVPMGSRVPNLSTRPL